jgi:capsular polysaccharide transport system permease protein
MRGRLSVHRFGAFWILFEPLAHIVVLMMIHTLLRGTIGNGIDFSMFLAAGVIPFILFKNIALKEMEAVNANKGLFAYRQIKPIDTVIARMIVECALMACVFLLVMFGLAMWAGVDVLIHKPLEWLLVMGLGIIFSFGLGLTFCIIGEALPEAKTFIKLLYMPLYFLSGVIMPIWIIPERFYTYMLWNPYLHFIELLRSETFSEYPESRGISMEYVFAVTLITLFLGLALYRVRRLKLIAV